MKPITLFCLLILLFAKISIAQEDTLVSKQQALDTTSSQVLNIDNSELVPSDTVILTKKSVLDSIWNETYISYKVDSVDFKRKSISQFGIGRSYLQNNYITSLTYPGVEF
ncbi:MAG: hypothetical protein IPO21_05405 [Bacteroidales bacterium]|nr:hypothetical protein [Bacteroidales bacterium]